MNQAQQALCRLMGAALFGADAALRPEELPWQEVYQTAEAQAVHTLLTEVLPEAQMPRQVYDEWLGAGMLQMREYYRYAKMHGEITALLNDAGIPFVFLKGLTVGVYYPRPELRPCGDIDILIGEDRAEEAVRILNTNGYGLQVLEERQEAFLRHYHLFKDGIMIEVHRYFRTRETKNEYRSEAYIMRNLRSPAVCTIQGKRFPKLPEEAEAIMLLRHMRHHMLTGMAFRQVLDFVMMAQSIDDEKWNARYAALTREYGVEALAKTICRMAQLYWGMPEEGHAWCRDIPESSCHRLMNYLLENSVFEEKTQDNTMDAVTAIGHVSDGAVFSLRWLWKAGVYNWPACRKHPWLKPFAGFYQLGHYAAKTFSRKNSCGTLLRDLRKVRDRKQLMRELKLDD